MRTRTSWLQKVATATLAARGQRHEVVVSANDSVARQSGAAWTPLRHLRLPLLPPAMAMAVAARRRRHQPAEGKFDASAPHEAAEWRIFVRADIAPVFVDVGARPPRRASACQCY